jgi:hypothetical protein
MYLPVARKKVQGIVSIDLPTTAIEYLGKQTDHYTPEIQANSSTTSTAQHCLLL